jgi:hypothetical protein
MQVPISLWSKTADLTIQWSGRKTEDGKIDPGYCRVLFYLDLENLKETIVDMVVQNRVLSVRIINENTNLKELASPFAQMLKNQLMDMDYRLSSISFEAPRPAGGTRNMTAANKLNPQARYKGVDIRI